jgi:hypothetical protein
MGSIPARLRSYAARSTPRISQAGRGECGKRNATHARHCISQGHLSASLILLAAGTSPAWVLSASIARTDVRFTPESRHQLRSPFCARSKQGAAYSSTSSALESNFSCLFARRAAAGGAGAGEPDSSAASADKLPRQVPARPMAELARGRSATSHHRYGYRSRCHSEPEGGRGRVAKFAKFGTASALPPLH